MMGKMGKKNASLYCAYHRDISHETEDYWEVKEEIESLIR